jgi:hypothetical protein
MDSHTFASEIELMLWPCADPVKYLRNLTNLTGYDMEVSQKCAFCKQRGGVRGPYRRSLSGHGAGLFLRRAKNSPGTRD